MIIMGLGVKFFAFLFTFQFGGSSRGHEHRPMGLDMRSD